MSTHPKLSANNGTLATIITTYTHCTFRFGETPSAEQVDEFKRVCSHFFAQHPGEIVGELEQCVAMVTVHLYRCALYSWLQQNRISRHFLSCGERRLGVSALDCSSNTMYVTS